MPRPGTQERGSRSHYTKSPPEKRDGTTVAGLQRAGGMAAVLATAKAGCAPREWAVGEGHSPSRAGQRLLKSEVGPSKEASLDWGQVGEHPTVSCVRAGNRTQCPDSDLGSGRPL